MEVFGLPRRPSFLQRMEKQGDVSVLARAYATLLVLTHEIFIHLSDGRIQPNRVPLRKCVESVRRRRSRIGIS